MEYKIFRHLRHNLKLPYILRLIFFILLVLIGAVLILLPFPGSGFLGTLAAIIGIVLLINAKKIKFVVKLRKSITHLFMNFHKKDIVKHKLNDISKHVNDILKDNDSKNN